MIPFNPWESIPSEPCAALLPWSPDWADGVPESLSWRMGSTTSQAGIEERRSVRRDPRQRIEFTTLIEPVDIPLLQSLLLGWSGATWAVPLWYGATSLSVEAVAGDDTLQVHDSLATLTSTGGWVAVWADSRTVEFAQVLSFDDTSVTLDTDIVGSFPIGAKVVPLQFMSLQSSQSFAPVTSAVARVSWVFEQVPGYSTALEVAGASSWSETFPTGAGNAEPRNHYLTCAHNWSGSPEVTVSTLVDQHDPGVGVLSRRAAVDIASPMWAIDVLLDSRAAVADLRRFLSAHRGPTVSFWAPSPLRDLGLDDDISGVDLVVANNAQHLVPPALRLGVEITHPSGEVRSLVTAVSPTTVTLADDPGSILWADVARQRWVSRVRLAVETVSIRHITNRIAVARLPVVAVLLDEDVDTLPTVTGPGDGGGGPDLGGGGDGAVEVYFSSPSYVWTDLSDVPPRATLLLSTPLGEDVTAQVTVVTSLGLAPSVTYVVDVTIPAGETSFTFSAGARADMRVLGAVYTLSLYEVSPLLRLGTLTGAIINVVP